MPLQNAGDSVSGRCSAPLPEQISEELIARLVETFYRRVRADAVLGPIFMAKLGEDWDPHLAKLRDFWSSVTLLSGRYRGRPQAAHARLGLAPADFERWLSLFEATVAEICTGPAAFLFTDRARRIGDSLQIGLGIGPKALVLSEAAATSGI